MTDNNSKEKNLRFREITIPGDVLDHEMLSDGAKIMYGKIARLSYKEGYCWASNSFLDGTKSGRNASRFIAELRKYGFIEIKNDRSKYREIWICSVESRVKNVNIEENSTPPDSAKLNVHRHFRRSYIASSGGVYIANSGEQTLQDSTNINSTSSSQKPFAEKEESTQENGKEAEADSFSHEKIKNAIFAIDQTFIFQVDFYSRAAAFMKRHNLDSGYLAWLYNQCELKNPNSYIGWYYKVFFEDVMAERYKAVRKPAQPPPPENIICPVCDTEHYKYDDLCPCCRLPIGSGQTMIDSYKDLQALPPDKREEYFRREENIFLQNNQSFEAIKTFQSALKKEFGLKVDNETPSRSVYSR